MSEVKCHRPQMSRSWIHRCLPTGAGRTIDLRFLLLALAPGNRLPDRPPRRSSEPTNSDIDPMRLMLLRHAKAEKAEPGQRDLERSLNARGRSDAETIGAYMARHKLVPDLAVVSPSRRTRETWERLFSVLAAEVAVSFEDHLYNARTDAILAVAKQTKSS